MEPKIGQEIAMTPNCSTSDQRTRPCTVDRRCGLFIQGSRLIVINMEMEDARDSMFGKSCTLFCFLSSFLLIVFLSAPRFVMHIYVSREVIT